MSPPCQFYNTGFIYFNLNYIITMLKSFNIKKGLFESVTIRPFEFCTLQSLVCWWIWYSSVWYLDVHCILRGKKISPRNTLVDKETLVNLWSAIPCNVIIACSNPHCIFPLSNKSLSLLSFDFYSLNLESYLKLNCNIWSRTWSNSWIF